MDIVIFGANGQTGRLLTRRALDKRHSVTAVTRHPDDFPFSDPLLTVVRADVREPSSLVEVVRAPFTSEQALAQASNLAKRLGSHGESYFRFITTPGLEPTNNLAEQAIRFVVIDRRITQGTRGERGDRWCERIWTVMATCSQQGRSVFAYLEAAVAAWFDGEEAPSLLPRGC